MRFVALGIFAVGVLACPGLNSKTYLWQVNSDQDWRSVAAGFETTCAIKNDDSLWCWGRNDYGQVSNTTYNHKTPVRVGADRAWNFVPRNHIGACGKTTGNEILCWGFNNRGDLGPDAGAVWGNPVAIAQPGSDWQAIAKGGSHTCGIRGGALSCWGWNWKGQFGAATPESSAIPVLLPGSDTYSSVDAFGDQTCAQTATGVIVCWGGEMVAADAGTNPKPPAAISPDTDWTHFSAGSESGAAIKADGSLWFWGRFKYEPLPVTRLGSESDWKAVSVGSSIGCGVRGDGSLWCWGFEEYTDDLLVGQGDHPTDPVRIDGANDWLTVSCGISHVCAMKTNHTLWCWGDDEEGERGNGDVDGESGGGFDD